MPWVRFDDHFPENRKVNGLSDTAFRLHVSAIFWCARNLTDGFVPEEDLELVTARVRAPARFCTELVRRGLWHEAGTQCDSEQCPPPTTGGWTIHDYWEYQPTKAKVLSDRAANAERQRLWREKQASQDGNALHQPNNGRSNGVSNGGSNSPPSRPVPKESSSNSHMSIAAARFPDLWAVYPRRDGRKEALAAFEKAINRGIDPDVIIDGASRYAQRVARLATPREKIKMAQGWINGDRWEDEKAQPAATAPRSLWDN